MIELFNVRIMTPQGDPLTVAENVTDEVAQVVGRALETCLHSDLVNQFNIMVFTDPA